MHTCTHTHSCVAMVQVPLNSWVVLATKRDGSKAYEFVEMMKKVCPSLGIKVSCTCSRCVWTDLVYGRICVVVVVVVYNYFCLL